MGLFDDPQVFDDPQLFDDPQVFDDQLEVWTLIIEKSTVIPPSLMVLFNSFTIETLVLVQKTCSSFDQLKATWGTFGPQKFLPIGHVVHVDLVGRSFCLPVPDRTHKLVTNIRTDFLASQFKSIQEKQDHRMHLAKFFF